MTNTLPMLDTAIVPFGVEHEYNVRGEPDICSCGDPDCDEEVYDSGAFPDYSPPEGWSLSGEHCGAELRTGIETDIDSVMATFEEFEDLYGGPNMHRDAGLHVHLNATPEIGPAVNPARFFENYLRFYEQLHEAAPDIEGRSSSYCRMVGDWTVPVWLNSGDRMIEVASTPLQSHGTIEVRLSKGTHDMDRFETWLRVLSWLAATSAYRDDESPAEVIAPHINPDSYGRYHLKYYLTSKCGHSTAEVESLMSRRVA